MTTLFSFDFEFTHPSPAVGAPMELGIAACEISFKDVGEKYPKPEFGTEVRTWRSNFAVPEGVKVSPWVQQNQGDLLERCRQYQEPGSFNERRISSLKSFIQALAKPVIPVGWCLGSDTAYLLHLLGEDCDLVPYSTRDLTKN
jgi:hypothetical protein